MLLDLWGLIQKNLFRGANSSSGKRSGIVVVEYEGKEYKVPEAHLQMFLKNIEKKVEKKAVKKRIKEVPQVVLKESPVAEEPHYAAMVQATNDTLTTIWNMIQVAQYDEDEDLILILGA